MNTHAKLSASGAHRWLACPASIKAEEPYPDQTSVYAAEGTAAHDLAEQCLNGGVNADEYLNGTIGDFTVDHEMVDAVQMYLDYVRSIPGQLLIEKRVEFSRWIPDGFGTADAIVINGSTVHVIDLKYGKGVKVYAEENPQAILYALGTLQSYGFLGLFKDFIVTIVQPRLDHISEWSVDHKQLTAYGSSFKAKANLTLSDDAPFNPGEKQCRFCKAKADCKPLAEFTLNIIADEFDGIGDELNPRDPDKLTPADIGQHILPHLKLIMDWMNAVEARAYSYLEHGKTVPGYKLVDGRSCRKWGNQIDAEKALRKISKLKVADIFTRKLISPTQAEKLLGKNHAVLENHCIKPKGKPALAPESDKRPAIVINMTDEFASVADSTLSHRS